MRSKTTKFILLASILYISFSSFFSGVSSASVATDKISELKQKIAELTQQAEKYRSNVLQKQREANTLKRQIDLLTNQVKRLEAEIGITERRITAATLEIGGLENKLFDTLRDIEFKKAAISETVMLVYERDQINLVAALFANPSISDFAQEAHQTTALNQQLSQLLDQLKEQKLALEDQKLQVEQQKQDLQQLNSRQINQKSSLSSTKNSQSKLLTDTKGQETKYQQLLNETERREAEFFDELRRLEQQAVADGTAIVHVTATSVPPRGSKIFKNPYHDRSYLTQGYGMTSYARRGAYGGAPHNGVDIASGCSSPIYAIGSGIVLASGFNIGFGNWIAVKHDGGGGMVSTYSHMVSGTILSNGTPVGVDSVLGYEGSSGNSTGCHLHLSLYKDFFTYINPKNGQLYFNYFEGTVDPDDYVN